MFRTGLIENHEVRESVSPGDLDSFLGDGWRHFGVNFFRYNATVMDGRLHFILPLRIDLSEWSPTRSQRRVQKKNLDLRTEVRPASIDDEKRALFMRHAERFSENRPTDLESFLHPEPAFIPCRCNEFAVYEGDRLVAVSFLAIGENAVSAIYGVFEPEFSNRSLGIFTMLKEIQFAREMGKRFYYSGYATMGASHYDYKKSFNGLYVYDWEGNWLPFPKNPAAEVGKNG